MQKEKRKSSPQYKQSNKWKQANDFYNVSTKLLNNFKQEKMLNINVNQTFTSNLYTKC